MPNNQGKLDQTWNSVLPGEAGVKGVGALFWQAQEARAKAAAACDIAEAARIAAVEAKTSAAAAHSLLRPGAAGVNAAGAVWVALGAIQASLTALDVKLDAIDAKLDQLHPGGDE